ncbi:YceI family protein [Mycolicibacterium sp. 018/SC-01/001]|uniref:YceI family protein n=1 Tax=Mycolicibacterium sp. 018/SC-01/001 TaxID=2592069 RepID=UPI00117D9E95|nr:YceI family protein [Mycolicibacterium sp. 018/SC-01/001]TRW89143.1 YceI family protein [Mycolicibacterium sp. 018/SC-01/001]
MANTATTDLTRLSGVWRLDPNATTLSWRTRLLFIPMAKGTVRAKAGHAEVSGAGTAGGMFVVDPASIESRIGKRDAHLQSADYFDAEKYPAITFTSREVRPVSPGEVQITGELEVHGRTSPLTVTGHVTARDGRATLTATARIGNDVLHLNGMGAFTTDVTVEAHYTLSEATS